MVMLCCCQMLVPFPGPKTRTWHQQYRVSVAPAKPQHETLPPHINDALGAQYWWRRWWGRHGRSNGVTKG
eukprot:3297875-Ditylum_brightwellii.AAC.1